jgi:exodeoxyribonuclease VII large subunit
VAAFVARRRERLADLGARLPDPRRQLALARERLEGPAARLATLLEKPRLLIDCRQALKALERVLESTSYANVLQRGFAVVRGPEGVIARAAGVTPGLALDIEFGDGHAAATGTGERPARAREAPARSREARAGTKPGAKRAKPPPGDEPQGSLL